MQSVSVKTAAWSSPIQAIAKFHAELTAIRKDFHAHPELAFEEVRTSGVVARSLELLGAEVHRGIGKTGVVALLRGRSNASGRMIGLRAEMDALPMGEENEFGHRSTRGGVMHGCGHDGHTAMLLGTARYLAATRNFDGCAVLIFQPAEEGHGGARAMIQDGLFQRFPCQAVYAIHNWPGLPVGKIGVNAGPMMAAADRVEIVIEGRGGHGAHPYLTVDPVLVAGHIITATQSIVARNINPLDSVVVSLCALQAGDVNAFNVVPRVAKLVGTVRSFRKSTQDMVEERLRLLCSQIAAGFGASATVRYERMYPATINTPSEAMFAAQVAEQLVGKTNVIRDLPPSMGSEDFSFMLHETPGAYLRIGQSGAEGGCFLHSSRYDFNDEIIPIGSGLLAALVERSMPLDSLVEEHA